MSLSYWYEKRSKNLFTLLGRRGAMFVWLLLALGAWTSPIFAETVVVTEDNAEDIVLAPEGTIFDVQVNPADPFYYDFSGIISGSGSLTKIGGGELFLSNSGNAYIGDTIVTGGTLRIADWNSIDPDAQIEVNGEGAVLFSNANIRLGNAEGSGYLDILGGGKVETKLYFHLHIGAQTNSFGEVNVSGKDSQGNVSTLQNGGRFYLGAANNGVGILNIFDGGKAVGAAVDLINGSISVSGKNSDDVSSLLDLTGTLNVGYYGGNGILTIEQGGNVVTTGKIAVGENANSTGQVTVSGADSLLRTSNESLYLGSAANGTGTMTILDGARVEVSQAVYVGFNNGHGELTVSGTGSSLSYNTGFNLGAAGSSTYGLVEILDGGEVSGSGMGYFASSADSYARMHIDGAGSSFSNTGTQFMIGQNGTGILDITDGGSATFAGGPLYLGYYATGSGTVTVDGTGSLLESTDSELHVGSSGTGVLSITDGGKVSIANGIILGYNDGSGTVTVDGIGSLLEATNLRVGRIGTGVLSITDGGEVSITSDIFIGSSAGSNGTVTVDGTGSLLESTGGNLRVGGSATGALNITDGGKVSSANDINLGGTNGFGTVTVDGIGSLLESTGGNLNVGFGGTGVLSITAGGRVEVATNAILSSSATSVGTVSVSGTGSSLEVGSNLEVGSRGQGSLVVQDGGYVSVADLYIGRYAGGSGTITVDGTGSSLQAVGGVSVGSMGTGLLNILNGATVNLNDSEVAVSNQGRLHISGSGSLLTGANSVNQQAGYLKLDDGGRIETGFFVVGVTSSGNPARAVISGKNTDGTVTTLKSTSSFYVGSNSRGFLDITDGALVQAQNPGSASFMINEDGILNVIGAHSTGTKSTLSAEQTIRVGYSSRGTLNVRDGAIVQTDEDITLGYWTPEAHGVVFVDSQSEIQARSISVGGTRTDYIGSGILLGTGKLTLSGNVLVNSRGTLYAGDYAGHIGTLTIDGDLTLSTGGTLRIDIGGEVGNPASDKVYVTGNLSSSGTIVLDLTSIHLSESYTVLEVLGNFVPPTFEYKLNGEDIGGTRAAGSISSGVAGQTVQVHVTAVNNENLTWNGTAGGVWDLTTANWTGAETTFLDGDSVTFTNVDGTVTLGGTGKTVAQLTVSGAGTNIVFDGNILADGSKTTLAANNTGKLILNLGTTGTVTLNGDNEFHGGITMDGGTLMIGNDRALGTYETNTTTPADSRGQVTVTGAATIGIEEHRVLSNRFNVTNGSLTFDIAEGKTLTIENVHNTANDPDDKGGAIYLGDAVTQFSLNDTTFRNNSAEYGGAMLFVSAGPTTFSTSGMMTFSGNTAISGGGAIHTGSGGYALTIINTGTLVFENNTAQGGGAIISQGLTIGGTGTVLFTGNSAFGGGAIETTLSGITLGSGVTFDGNSATNSGGAIMFNLWTTEALEIDGTTFQNNTATTHGGAVYNNTGLLTLVNDGDSKFIRNTAGNSGGAIFSSGAFTLTNTTGSVEFIGNTATSGRGGAIYANGDMTLGSNIVFSENAVPDASGGGGALYVGANGSLSLSGNTLFENNCAGQYGGAVSMAGGTSTLSLDATGGHIAFTGNTANNAANAIYAAGAVAIELSGSNNIYFDDPIAGSVGGSSLTMDGTGFVQFAGIGYLNPNGTDGTVDVNSGTLRIVENGALASGSNSLNWNFTLGPGGTLAGNGTFTAQAGFLLNGTVSPDSDRFEIPDGIGTLSVQSARSTVDEDKKIGTLRFEGDTDFDGAILMFDLGPGNTSDRIAVTGTASHGGDTLLKLSNWEIGTFELITATVGGIDKDQFSIDQAILTGRRNVKFNGTGTQFLLETHENDNLSLTWTGGTGALNTTATNWTGADGVNQFLDGDAVNFAAAGAGTVTVDAGGVGVSGMNITGGTYTFTGGKIDANKTVVGNKITNPTGTFTLSGGTATFTDITFEFVEMGTISGGKLTVGSGATLSSPTDYFSSSLALRVNGGGILEIRDGGKVSFANAVSSAISITSNDSSVIVDGAGSELSTNSHIDIATNGSLIVRNSAKAIANRVYVGLSGEGTLLVDGSDSELSVTGINIGHNGNGHVTIQNGGKIIAAGAGVSIGSLNGGNGTVFLNGSDTLIQGGSISIGVAADTSAALLSGNGQVVTATGTGNVTLYQSGTITPGNADVAEEKIGTLDITGNLVLDGGTLAIDIASASNYDSLALGSVNTVTFGTNKNTISIDQFVSGTFDIVKIAGGGTGTVDDITDKFNDLIFDIALNERQTATLQRSTDEKAIQVAMVAGNNLALTWNATDGTWDTTSENWLADDPTVKTFVDGDSVTFGGTGTKTVTLTADRTVSGMTVSGGEYTFTGGKITGNTNVVGDNFTPTGKLSVTAGSVTFENALDFSDIIDISDGASVTFSGTGNRTDTSNIDNAGTLHFNPSEGATHTYGGIISGTGTVAKNGAGTLVLSGANNATGTFSQNAGAVLLAGNWGGDYTQAAAAGFFESEQVSSIVGTATFYSTVAINGDLSVRDDLNLDGTTDIYLGRTSADGGVYIGKTAGTAAITTLAAGTTLQSVFNIDVGYRGSGTLILNAGALVSASNNVTIGGLNGSSGTIMLLGGETTKLKADGGSMIIGSGNMKSVLGGTGTVEVGSGTGTIELSSLGILSPGDADGSIGTLKLDGNINMHGTLKIDLPTTGNTSDLITVTGNAVIENAVIDLTSWQSGTYTFLTVAGTIENGEGNVVTDPTDLFTVTLGGNALSARQGTSVSLNSQNAGELQLSAFTNNVALTWNVGDGDWDTVSENWLYTGDANLKTFVDGDHVTFGGTGKKTVTLNANRTVSGMNVSGGEYTFSGTGRIAGNIGYEQLQVTGADTVVRMNAETGFGGGVTMSGGTFVLGHDKALGVHAWGTGQGTLTASGDATLSTEEDRTISNRIVIDNAATLTLDTADNTLVIENITINTGDVTSGYGGAIAIGLNSEVLKATSGHLVLRNNTATVGAGIAVGASYWQTGIVADQDFSGFESMLFESNTATSTQVGGGGVFSYSSIIFGDNVTFRSNSASQGSAINSRGDVSLGDNATFSLNTATTGTIWANNVTLGHFATFTSNTGGGINALEVTLGDNATFTSNDGGSFNSGAIHSLGTVTIGKNASFTSNTTDADGGAIYSPANLSIGDNAIFTSNTAGGKGGAIYGAYIDIGKNATFSGNTGGAIFTVSGLTLQGNTLFANNTAAGSGGAVSTNDSIAMIQLNATSGDIAFTGNLAAGQADSIFLEGNKTLAFSGTGNIYFDDPISSGVTGGNSLSKTGTGFVQFMGDSVLNLAGTPGGTVSVTSGTFRVVDGSSFTTLGNDAVFTVSTGAVLSGGGSLTVENGFTISGTVSPDIARFAIPSTLDGSVNTPVVTNGDRIGTLTLTGDTTFSGATLQIDLGNGVSDRIDVDGDVAFVLNGTTGNKLDIGLWSVGSYTILSTTGTVNDITGLFDAITIGGASLGSRQSAVLSRNATDTALILTTAGGNNLDLVWTGAVGSGWNTTDLNWASGETYNAGDYVTFNAIASNRSVTIDGNVQVSGMKVTVSNYRFGGTGSIVGTAPASGGQTVTGKLELSATGMTTIDVATDFVNGTEISGGTVVVGHDSAFGQLGSGDKGHVNVLADATLSIDGNRTLNNRFTVQNGAELEIDIAAGATLTIDGTGSTDDVLLSAEKGTIRWTSGGYLVLRETHSGGVQGISFDFTPLAGTIFSRNSTDWEGGAAYVTGSISVSGNTLFTDNTAAGPGGAIYLAGTESSNFVSIDAEGGDIAFVHNTSGGVANSIHLEKNGQLLLSGSGNIFFDDPISSGVTGDNGLSKTGTGFVQFVGDSVLNLAGTPGGTVSVTSGTFRVVDGSSFTTLGNDAVFTVSTGAVLSGGGSLTAENGFTISGTISPDSHRFETPSSLGTANPDPSYSLVPDVDRIGTLTLTGDVLLDGTMLLIDLNGTTSDRIVIGGDLSYGANSHVDIGTWNIGVYTILTGGNLDLSHFDSDVTFNGSSLGSRQSAILSVQGENLLLTTSGAAAFNLLWTGENGSTWNTTAKNWAGGHTYNADDFVIFDASAVNQSVTVDGGAQVAGMEIRGGHYRFNGDKITGTLVTSIGQDVTGRLDLLAGSARLDLETDFVEGIRLAGGTLTVVQEKSLGTDTGTGSRGTLEVVGDATLQTETDLTQGNRIFVRSGGNLVADVAEGSTLSLTGTSHGRSAVVVEDGASLHFTAGSGHLTASGTADSAFVNRGTLDFSGLRSLRIGGNETTGSGGGVATTGTLVLPGNTLLSGNTATVSGGAVFASNAQLTLHAEGGDIAFTGNTAGGAANSLHLETNTALTVSGSGNVYFDDPIGSGVGGNSFHKTGSGFVQFVGNNVLNPAGSDGGSVSVSAGIFRVANGAWFRTSGTGSTFAVSSGGTLAGGGRISSENGFDVSGTISPDADRFTIPTLLDGVAAPGITNRFGTLTLAGNLRLDGAALAVDLDAANVSDRIAVEGDITFGTNENLISLYTWTHGTYGILSATGTFESIDDRFRIEYLGETVDTAWLQMSGGTMQLVVSQYAPDNFHEWTLETGGTEGNLAPETFPDDALVHYAGQGVEDVTVNGEVAMAGLITTGGNYHFYPTIKDDTTSTIVITANPEFDNQRFNGMLAVTNGASVELATSIHAENGTHIENATVVVSADEVFGVYQQDAENDGHSAGQVTVVGNSEIIINTETTLAVRSVVTSGATLNLVGNDDTEATFANVQAEGIDGAAFHVAQNATLNVVGHVNIVNNETTGTGGGVFLDGATVNFDSSEGGIAVIGNTDAQGESDIALAGSGNTIAGTGSEAVEGTVIGVIRAVAGSTDNILIIDTDSFVQTSGESLLNNSATFRMLGVMSDSELSETWTEKEAVRVAAGAWRIPEGGRFDSGEDTLIKIDSAGSIAAGGTVKATQFDIIGRLDPDRADFRPSSKIIHDELQAGTLTLDGNVRLSGAELTTDLKRDNLSDKVVVTGVMTFGGTNAVNVNAWQSGTFVVLESLDGFIEDVAALHFGGVLFGGEALVGDRLSATLSTVDDTLVLETTVFRRMNLRWTGGDDDGLLNMASTGNWVDENGNAARFAPTDFLYFDDTGRQGTITLGGVDGTTGGRTVSGIVFSGGEYTLQGGDLFGIKTAADDGNLIVADGVIAFHNNVFFEGDIQILGGAEVTLTDRNAFHAGERFLLAETASLTLQPGDDLIRASNVVLDGSISMTAEPLPTTHRSPRFYDMIVSTGEALDADRIQEIFDYTIGLLNREAVFSEDGRSMDLLYTATTLDEYARKNVFTDNETAYADYLRDTFNLWEMEEFELGLMELDDAGLRSLFAELSGAAFITEARQMTLSDPYRVVSRHFVEESDTRRMRSGIIRSNDRKSNRSTNNFWFVSQQREVEQDGDGNARGYRISRTGLYLGGDRRISQRLLAGFLFGYGNPKLYRNSDRIENDDLTFAGYFKYRPNSDWDLNVFAGYGNQRYETRRWIFGEKANGSFDGDSFHTTLEVVRNIRLTRQFMVLPTVGLDFQKAWVDAFDETGAGFSQRYEKDDLARTSMRFGLNTRWNSSDRTRIDTRLQYGRHLDGKSSASIRTALAGSTADPMTLHGVAVGRDVFNVGVGGHVLLDGAGRSRLYGNYDFDRGNRSKAHTAEVGFQHAW